MSDMQSKYENPINGSRSDATEHAAKPAVTDAPHSDHQEKGSRAPFEVRGNCLYVTTASKRGSSTAKVCNFVPRIVSEKTVDDGAVTEKTLVLSGIHADGSTLPPVEVNGADLSSFNWLLDKWGAKCIIEVGPRCREYLRYYIQTTADSADRLTEYHVTGWKKIDGEWHYLLPGDDSLNVTLKGKLQHYCGEQGFTPEDLIDAYDLFEKPPAPSRVIQPLVAFTFLTPLNEFMRQAGCMPKFALFLTGRTGTRKSTIAALILSFFGRFTSTDLPMSFRDTANSIIANSFSLKDVLTCIDDFYPSDNAEMKKLNATAQTVMRAYGDRTGRARLRSDSTLMESRPPQGNAIITGELSPDIGESGTARYFALELKEGDVDLSRLTLCQNDAENGAYRRTMTAYTQWLKQSFLSDGDCTSEFVAVLSKLYREYRTDYIHHNLTCHGRLPETVASLMVGMRFFLQFLKEIGVIKQEEQDFDLDEFRKLLYALADIQSEKVEQDKPAHVFIRKLWSLIEGGKVLITERNRPKEFDPFPPGYIGCQDGDYYYLNKELAHSAVKKLCTEQGESFPLSAKALVKALAEEGLIKTTPSGNTVSLRYCERNLRYMALDKQKAQAVLREEQ
ncbi:MAG: hypothetical protein II163_02025 [Ruminococcus sp.]|nr:hypothetical protein [Ruminococcus sp.]MBQ1897927.1 hypothetical protein [Ruminococcus sp.]